MKAIIMAGGEGSRLRPLTCDIPKPMVPIFNRPIIDHIIDLLKQHGIVDIGITLMFMPQKIRDYLGNGVAHGVNIRYFVEEIPLGTAGSVRNAIDFLDDTFLVISGDSLTDINLTEAINFHKEKKSISTIILKQVEVPLEYGVVLMDPDNSITGFLEKPSWSEVFSDTANTGTYIFEPEIFDYIPENTKFDFSQDVFPKLLSDKKNLYGYNTDAYWCDIGDLNAYLKAHYDVLDNKISLNLGAKQIRKGVWVGPGTDIEPNSEVNAPCFIGANCKIGNGTVIDNYSVVGDNTTIEDEVSVKRSILWDSCSVGFGSEIRAAILCSHVKLKQYVSVFENAVIGDNCIINERAIVKPNIKLWPQKVIEPLAVADRNIVWSTRQSKTIFGENGISGVINVDISPEFAARLGAAYGSTFKKNTKIVVSSTIANPARMFKHAFVSGMLSVGIEVYNLSSLLTPIARHAVGFLSVEGGIHIKLSENNLNRIVVDFMNEKGANISRLMERKIENAYFKEDFKRCTGEEISRLNNLTDYRNYYIRALTKIINVDLIKSKQPRICVYSPSDFVISVVINMFTELGCEIASFHTSSLDDLHNQLHELDTSDADFAAFIDSNAENLILLDRFGNIIKDDMFLVLISLIMFRTENSSKVVIPITAPSVIESIAKKYNREVQRTKSTQQAVMEDLLFFEADKKHPNMTQFILNFDALAGLGKIIEFLCKENITLHELITEIPDFYIGRKNVFCPWEMKGKVMRTLISENSGEKIELLDGVKFIFEDGWVLVLPDAEMPLCRIYSESNSLAEANSYIEKYANKIEVITNENN